MMLIKYQEFALLTALGLALLYVFNHIFVIWRTKRLGNRLPGPKESVLWGNAADMQAQGGLVLFLDSLHDRYIHLCPTCIKRWRTCKLFYYRATVRSQTAAPAAALNMQHCLWCRYGPIARFWEGFGDLSISINDPQLLERVDAIKLEKRLDGLDFLKGLLGARGIGCARLLGTQAENFFPVYPPFLNMLSRVPVG